MKDSERETFADAFADLFPSAPAGDVKLCWEKCRGFELATVNQAIEQHRLALGAAVWRPDLRQIVALCWRIERPGVAAIDRTTAYLDTMRKQAVATQDEWNAIDTLIANLTDEQLQAYRDEAMGVLPPLIAKAIAKVGPRESRTLKAWIAERIGHAKAYEGGRGRAE